VVHIRRLMWQPSDMEEELSWRPSIREIAEAGRLLAGKPRFQTRLNMVRGLKSRRHAPLHTIARSAHIRTSVVRGFLKRWQIYGLESVVAFGPNMALTKTQLQELKKSIRRNRPASLAGIGRAIKSKFGLVLSRQTIRSYCQQCGIEWRKTADRTVIKLHKTWTEDNVTEIAGENRALKGRLIAILRACEQPTLSLRKVAARSSPALVAESTLRTDLKTIKPTTTLVRFVERRKRLPLLDRLSLRHIFYAWATRHCAAKAKAPSASEAVAFLKAEHAVNITIKSAYNCLGDWKHDARIGKRKYNRREKLVPSEGLAVRSMR